jgi:hypothetical protein
MAGYDNYAKMIFPGQPFLITPDDDNNLPYVTKEERTAAMLNWLDGS